MRDLVPDIEDQIPRVRVLALLAVDQAAYAERVRIAGLVGRRDPGTDRSVRIERFAENPLRGLELPGAFGDVVAATIAEYGRRRVRFALVSSLPSNHHDEFGLVVDVLAGARYHNRIEGTIDRRRHLRKPDLVLGLRLLGLFDVIGIVEPNRQDLSWPGNGRFELHLRQLDA